VTNSVVDSLEEIGLTGALLATVTNEARFAYFSNPRSVYLFSVWSALADLGAYLEDEQGIELSKWNKINAAAKDCLAQLIRVDGTHAESADGVLALQDLLEALYHLRWTDRISP
jgi:hypothetical protein